MTILQKHLVFVPIFFVVFFASFGWVVMLLWNWLMPYIFSLPELEFCQAVGLLVLCKILFGGIGGGHHGHHGHGHCHEGKNKLRERWENMTPEERQRIVEMHKGLDNLSPNYKLDKYMANTEKPCANCKLRANYEKNPKSLLGRLWRWHINFCPGWKGYFTSLDEETKQVLREKYNFKKY